MLHRPCTNQVVDCPSQHAFHMRRCTNKAHATRETPSTSARALTPLCATDKHLPVLQCYCCTCLPFVLITSTLDKCTILEEALKLTMLCQGLGLQRGIARSRMQQVLQQTERCLYAVASSCNAVDAAVHQALSAGPQKRSLCSWTFCSSRCCLLPAARERCFIWRSKAGSKQMHLSSLYNPVTMHAGAYCHPNSPSRFLPGAGMTLAHQIKPSY